MIRGAKGHWNINWTTPRRRHTSTTCHVAVPAGEPLTSHMGTRSPALSLGRLRRAPTDPQKPLPAQPSHQEACTRDLTIGKHR
jgi:hypothetical protein